jgi:hypothetical protein
MCKPHIVADLDYEDVAHDLGYDMAGLVGDQLRVRWVDNGIGPYEFWGAKGVDVRWCAEVDEGAILVDVTDLGVIPVTGRGSCTAGGCDGEHRGPCNQHCWEAEVEFTITLTQVKWVEKRLIAWYEINQE